MASVWIRTRPTKDGAKRYRVEYRVEGRYSKIRYGGSFRSQREALERKRYVAAELAGKRVPDLAFREADAPKVPTLREASEVWRSSRIDVDEGTRTNDRVNTERIFRHDPRLAATRIDMLDTEAWASTFADLATLPRGDKPPTSETR